jgi:hypothetical protein
VLIAQRPTLSEESVDEFRSRFVIEPLEPGFGYTLGNSLRRTLLSSIPGASVTSIRVDSVLHEFSTIEGVKEDVTEVILNLKALVVSSEHDEPVTMYLRKSGAGDVTAADIAPPAGVEVHNPDLKIATLSDKGKLEMELVVERGRGYVSAVQNKGADNEIGRMPVDSIYSPVLKVTYLERYFTYLIKWRKVRIHQNYGLCHFSGPPVSSGAPRVRPDHLGLWGAGPLLVSSIEKVSPSGGIDPCRSRGQRNAPSRGRGKMRQFD